MLDRRSYILNKSKVVFNQDAREELDMNIG